MVRGGDGGSAARGGGELAARGGGELAASTVRGGGSMTRNPSVKFNRMMLSEPPARLHAGSCRCAGSGSQRVVRPARRMLRG